MISSLFVLAGIDFSTLPQQLVNGLQLGAIYALIALGYTMVYGVLKLINFAHGEVFMVGAYVALFMSWGLGFAPDATKNPAANVWFLVLMLLASMVLCAALGVFIERFAYRPMRNNSRIASLITAIGVSMLLQFGGALFLPVSPPPSISEKLNPYRGAIEIPIIPHDRTLQAANDQLTKDRDSAQGEFDAYLQKSGEGEFSLSDKGKEVRDKARSAEKPTQTTRPSSIERALF